MHGKKFVKYFLLKNANETSKEIKQKTYFYKIKTKNKSEVKDKMIQTIKPKF